MTNQKGFTLIELMIVIAIIGILAAVAIPQYSKYIARTEVTSALAACRGNMLSVEEYYGRYGAVPTLAQVADYVVPLAAALPAATSDTLAACGYADGGLMTYTMAAGVSNAVAGKTFIGTFNGAGWTFAKGTGSMDAEYVPK